MAKADPAAVSAFLDAVFAELQHCGVRDIVVSPGSRSTPLAMKALERFANVYVDIDERGAAFFALGLSKASHHPTVVICTSGTAVGNWMPAVLEAESSRVPLLFLSGDRPPRLQQLGAPQTCDQVKLFSDHVKRFVQMPLPTADKPAVAFARQTALEACSAAYGAVPGAISCDGGPVHINFPFEEPLKPAAGIAESVPGLPANVTPLQSISPRDAAGLFDMLKDKRVVALCGEGTVRGAGDARTLLEFANKRNIPLLADPLSGLRQFGDPLVIDNYDSIFGHDDEPLVDVVIRFGRWPVSKRCFQRITEQEPVQIVVDTRDTRDFSSGTDLFVRATAPAFASALLAVNMVGTSSATCAKAWQVRNDDARMRIEAARHASDADSFEGAYVLQLMEDIPAGSLLFSASSMSIRALDTFYLRQPKPMQVLCNRGLNGIDGTLSSAIGAAQHFGQTTLLTGDLAFLHDLNALALQSEMMRRTALEGRRSPSIVVVCLNNNGGAIFDMLPQKSDEPYFERLFLTPQSVDFGAAAAAFGVPFERVDNLHAFHRQYTRMLGVPGISVLEVSVPREGVAQRYNPYW